MAHISVLTNGIYTGLAYAATPGNFKTQATLEAAFATPPVNVRNIREFPEFSETADNVVNVPSFNSDISRAINAQAELEPLEFTLNYVPSMHADLHAMAGNGNVYAFQIILSDKIPVNLLQVPDTGVGSNETANTIFNFAARVASFDVIPSLSDSLTAKVVLSPQSEIFGPLTYGAVPSNFLTAPNGDAYTDSFGNPLWL